MLKTVDTLSNLIRSVVALLAVGLVSYGGWIGYSTWNEKDLALKKKDSELAESQVRIGQLNKDLEVKQREIERLATAVRLLKVDHRIAQVRVKSQKEQTPGDPSSLTTTFTFVEVDDAGRTLDEKQEREPFTIKGDIVYIDALVVKFKDELIEQGDPTRGTSICLFRRIFGEKQTPEDGFVLDPVGSRPAAYSRGSEMSSVEQEIWSHFWDYATDPDKAEAAGVRSAQGEAPSTRLLPGKLYRIELRASGGLTIVPENLPEEAGKTL